MTVALQIVALSVVMLLGLAVVFSHDPLRQTVVNGIFGLSLVVLFLVLQAPDVGISELVVASIAFPLVLLTAIYQTRDESEK